LEEEGRRGLEGGGRGGEEEEEGKREIRCDIGIFTTDFDLGDGRVVFVQWEEG